MVDRSEVGLCVEIGKALPLGMAVHIEVHKANGDLEIWTGVVCWVKNHGSDGYRAGIEAEQKERANRNQDGEEDLYELLQVNPKADFDTIHRIYRMLAQRYHPDQKETGNPEKFQRVLEAYQTLSDLERRAAYDVKRAAAQQRTWDVFRNQKEADGPGAERRKRIMVLAMMYRIRMRKPQAPFVQLREVEEVLGIEKEHLDFSLWYLREKGYLTRTDNGRYAITAMGVEAYEDVENATPDQELRAIEGRRSQATV
jgi:curved DNA-binding protein